MDKHFQASILRRLKEQHFSVVKALSPTDLTWIMTTIGIFLVQRGNTLSNVAEYARFCDEGIFLNGQSWKRTIVQLFHSASIFLVYVSNQSRGLQFELQSLLDRHLERNTVVVLDKRRFGSRRSFFEIQERLESDLHSSVVKDASVADDPNEFERLLRQFPLAIDVPGDILERDTESLIQGGLARENRLEVSREVVKQRDAETQTKLNEFQQAIVPFINEALRHPPSRPTEIPFDFGVSMGDAEAKLNEFRDLVSQRVEEITDRSNVSNWPAALLFIELHVFLHLICGRTCEAAKSMARYATVADLTNECVERLLPESVEDVREELQQHGNMAMNVAVDALMMGEWNDYSDRRALARKLVAETMGEMRDALSASVAASTKVTMKVRRPKGILTEDATVDAQVALAREMLERAPTR